MSTVSKLLVGVLLLTLLCAAVVGGNAVADGIANPTASLGGNSVNIGEGPNNSNRGKRNTGSSPCTGAIDLSLGCPMPMLNGA